MGGASQGSVVLDQATAQGLLSTGEKLQWQQVQEYDRQPTAAKKFGSETSHLTAVFAGWAVIVGGSVAKSLFDPSKRHLLLSHRLIHARITAQWCDDPSFASPRPQLPKRLRAIPSRAETPIDVSYADRDCRCARATVGALIAAGATEKLVSMYGSRAAPMAAAESVSPSAVYEARQPSRKEDWTRL